MQELNEWIEEIQDMIDKYQILLSNHGDKYDKELYQKVIDTWSKRLNILLKIKAEAVIH